MTTKIFEELPSRGNKPESSAAERSGPTDMKAKMEKKVRQAVYDIRYRARREGIDVKQAYSQYMQNSSLNGQERNLVKAKIFGRPMAEDYNIEEFASSSVANALFKVFVEGVEKEESTLGEKYLQELKNLSDRKYKVRVTDKNGTSYVRYATRDKISDLRSNPNIESVEMTEYGEPYEGERTGGKQTAAAKAGKDYDGDGKVESGAKEYRGAVHNAIQRNKGGRPDGKDTSSVKEDIDFFEEEKNKKKDKKYDVMRGKNDGRVKLFPEVGKSYNEEFFPESSVSTAQQKFMGMVHAYKKGEMKNASPAVKKAAKEMSDTEAKKFASTKHKGLPSHVQAEETSCGSSELKMDTRGDYAKKEVLKNKLRSALGVKNPIIMTAEGTGLSVGVSKLAGQILANPRTSAEQGAKNFQKNVTDPVGRAAKGAVRALVLPLDMSPEAQKARKDKYRLEEVEFEGELVDESRLGDRAQSIEKDEAKKGGLRRARSKREEIAGNIRYSQNVDPQGDLGRQKAPKDTGLHRGETRPSSEEDDETPRRRRRDNNPALTARERNPNLR